MPLAGWAMVIAAAALAATHALTGATETARAPSNPMITAALAPSERFVIEGAVEERVDAGSYVYLRVDGTWVATLAATATLAPRVRVLAIGRARDFVSPRLGRRFDVLVLGVVRAAPSAARGEE